MSDAPRPRLAPVPNVDTGHLGLTLRRLYERSVDIQPLTDDQVALLLRLRQRERERRTA